MGDMADFCNDYQDGTMDEYHGFFSGRVDIPYGEQMPVADSALMIQSTTYEGLLAEIGLVEQALTHGGGGAYADPGEWVNGRLLNAEAIENLSREAPTCNKCRDIMTAREGRFGKFYFCHNRCEGQKTVSDSYWQTMRR